jgi:hypothetical protein
MFVVKFGSAKNETKQNKTKQNKTIVSIRRCIRGYDDDMFEWQDNDLFVYDY